MAPVARTSREVLGGTGFLAAAHLFVLSLSGSLIVYRDELFGLGLSVESLVDLHANLLTGETGRFINGLGALCLTPLCLTGAAIWWPGIKHWRRSLKVGLGLRSEMAGSEVSTIGGI